MKFSLGGHHKNSGALISNAPPAQRSATLPRRMAAPFVPLATQRPVRLITLGIGKSNRTLVPIGKDYQVRCLLRHITRCTQQAGTKALCHHTGDRSILGQRQRRGRRRRGRR